MSARWSVSKKAWYSLVAILAGVLGLGSLCQTAYAKTISTVFDASIPDSFKTDINFAVAEWNELLPTMPFTTTITFDLKNIGGPGDAGLTTYDTLDDKGRVKTSTIDFNTHATFFLDPTPADDSKFQLRESALRQNAAAAPDTVVSGLAGPAAIADAMGKWDLVSVAKHEIGHALGIGLNGSDPAGYKLFENAVTAGSGGGFHGFNIGSQFASLFPSGKLPVARIPTTDSHYDGRAQGGVFNNTEMASPGFQRGQRSLVTDLDILGVGSIYNLGENDITLDRITSIDESANFTRGLTFAPTPGTLFLCETPGLALAPGNCASRAALFSDAVVFNQTGPTAGTAMMDSDLPDVGEGASPGDLVSIFFNTPFFSMSEPGIENGTQTFFYEPSSGQPGFDLGSDLVIYQITSDIVPEPGTLLLFTTGILLLGAAVRRRRSRPSGLSATLPPPATSA